MPKRRGCCSSIPILGVIVVAVPLCVVWLAFAPRGSNEAPALTMSPATFTPTTAPTALVTPTDTTYRVVMPVVLAVASPTPLPVPTSTPTIIVAVIPPTVAPSAPPAVATVDTRSAVISPFECKDGCAVSPDPSCAIKGNVNSDGERIYHEPGGRSYARTDIKPEEGDRWFCTAAEAVAAGFRAPEND